MSKAGEAKTSPFDALRIARRGAGEKGVEGTAATGKDPESSDPAVDRGAPKALAKSVDPQYTKFTTYIRKETHLGVKTRLVGEQREMSDLVEELLTEWLRKSDS